MASQTPVSESRVAATMALHSALPPAPRSVEETGLDLLFLVELVAKVLFTRGQLSLVALGAHLRLPVTVVESVLGFMRGERLVEVVKRGGTDGDVHFQLTDTGRVRAQAFQERSRYAGVAPVGLQAYCDAVEAQSVAGQQITREDVQRAFAGIVVNPFVLDQVGAAMNSGRAMFLHGAAGSGKTFLAEHLRLLLKGDVLVPHAVAVSGEVIQIFDPLVHEPIDAPAAGGGLDRSERGDTRWVRCRRPMVLSGGELRMAMLDLDFDESTRFYQAPPHLKANNGIYVVDDLGRQLVSAQELMNRWIVPLDRHRDYLSLRTGHKFAVPFDVVVVFSTNLRPLDLADEAFLRRIGYKIKIGALSEDEYRQVFKGVCADCGIAFREDMLQLLLRDYHARDQRPLLACYPRDIVSQLRDFAVYERTAPELTPAALDRAWHNYFIGE